MQLKIYIVYIMPFLHVRDFTDKTLKNKNFRKSVYHSDNMELLLINIPPNEEIGMEVHKHEDQYVRVEEGMGTAVLHKTNSKKSKIKEGDVIVIPKGKWHNIINTSTKPLKLSVIYSPSEEHPH